MLASTLLMVGWAAAAVPQVAEGQDPMPEDTFLVAKDVPYVEGGDPKLQSLDVYGSSEAKDAPVLVYLHGGSLRGGDKREVAQKPEFFCPRGWLLVSINYRLSPEVQHPDHVVDVAAAVAWVAANIGDYGGDPERIAVVAHSAGALLGGILATDHRRLAAHGLGLKVLRAVVLLDGNMYALDERMRKEGPVMSPEALEKVQAKFGSAPDGWRDATAMRHVAADKDIPPILLIAAGVPREANQVPGQTAKAFLMALSKAGVTAEYYFAPDKTHRAVNEDLTSNDEMSQRAVSFLERFI